MIERDELATLLADDQDLDYVVRAVARERTIRQVMIQSGEGRAVVAEMVDAMDSMAQEAVLDLEEGEPTTMRAALQTYVAELNKRDPDGDELTPVARVSDELTMILNYPWSEEEERVQLHNPHYGLALHVVQQEFDRTEVRMGNNQHLVANVHHSGDDANAVREVAEAVHRATLARVIADREHIVRLNATQAADLAQWLARPSGSMGDGHRLTLDASGGGVLVRTRPFAHQADSQLSKLI